nr:protein kinase [Ardenticatenales bacterium]
MPITISIPKKIRQYSLDRLLTEVQAITDDSQPDKLVITFNKAEEIPCSLVFRAHHKDLQLDVAMRAIPVTKEARAPTIAKTVRAVVQQMWEVRQEHIVNLIDYGEEQGGLEEGQVPLYFFVSEYLKGRQQITDVLTTSEDLTEHLNLLNQALHALEYAHRRSIVHGRLHPGNLLVEVRNGQLFLRVTDFGHHTIDQMSAVPSKYETYIHPSHVNQVSEQGDLYSLGSVFYQILTEEPPSHRIKPMIATLRRRYRSSYPQIVQALEAAWS